MNGLEKRSANDPKTIADDAAPNNEKVAISNFVNPDAKRKLIIPLHTRAAFGLEMFIINP